MPKNLPQSLKTTVFPNQFTKGALDVGEGPFVKKLLADGEHMRPYPPILCALNQVRCI